MHTSSHQQQRNLPRTRSPSAKLTSSKSAMATMPYLGNRVWPLPSFVRAHAIFSRCSITFRHVLMRCIRTHQSSHGDHSICHLSSQGDHSICYLPSQGDHLSPSGAGHDHGSSAARNLGSQSAGTMWRDAFSTPMGGRRALRPNMAASRVACLPASLIWQLHVWRVFWLSLLVSFPHSTASTCTSYLLGKLACQYLLSNDSTAT